jgi:type IV pilus assembly protein PilV
MNKGTQKTMQTPRYASGFALMEVLIAFFLLSVGLLGAVTLMINSVSTSTTAVSRIQATFIANEIIERMRANPPGVNAGNYSRALAAVACGAAPAAVCSRKPGDDVSNDASGCTSAQMAANDLFEVLCPTVAANARSTNYLSNLPSPRLSIICVDPGASNCNLNTTDPRAIWEVSVRWTDPGDPNENNITLPTMVIYDDNI